MNAAHGSIDQSELGRKNDYLFRLSLKAIIVNERGEVLVVKESGRAYWDLPGGGMDFGENIQAALARELAEEVNMQGDFEYRVIDIDEPVFLKRVNVWQVRAIFKVTPEVMTFSVGEDADEILFVSPTKFAQSAHSVERRIAAYWRMLNN